MFPDHRTYVLHPNLDIVTQPLRKEIETQKHIYDMKKLSSILDKEGFKT